jgi:AraC family transcriptional regulator
MFHVPMSMSRVVQARTNSNKPSHALDDRRLQRVLQFVDENLQGSIALKDLAAIANLSPFYFARAFRRVTGSSPQRYVRQRRLETAKQLLSDGRASLADVALASNFSSQSSFTRAFTRAFGVAPGKYRESHGRSGKEP